MPGLIVNWDVELFQAINGFAERSAVLDAMMLALARPSTVVVPAILGFGCWLWFKKREALIGTAALAGLIIVTDLLGAQVKHLVARTRPCWVLQNVHQLVGCGGTFSFPSNHAVNTAAVAFLQTLYPRSGWVTWPLVAAIGVSRVYVGAHYVTDVMGGWLIGGIFGLGAALLLVRSRFFQTGTTTSRLAPRA